MKEVFFRFNSHGDVASQYCCTCVHYQVDQVAVCFHMQRVRQPDRAGMTPATWLNYYNHKMGKE